MSDDSTTTQKVLGPDGADLALIAGLSAEEVPAHLALPGYEAWGGAYSFGNAEMDSHQVTCERYLELAQDAGWPVFALGDNPSWQNNPDTYPIAPHQGIEIDPVSTPGLLILTPHGLRVAEDVWDLFANGPCTSETGWAPAALLV